MDWRNGTPQAPGPNAASRAARPGCSVPGAEDQPPEAREAPQGRPPAREAERAILAAAAGIAALGECEPRMARDPVNPPMIRNWTEAMGDTNPVYTDAAFAAGSVHGGLVAPPAMAQVWTMRGLHPAPDPGDPLGLMSQVLDEAGFTSVVATNCEQTYHRYLRHGEQVSVRSTLEEVTGPKRTSLGDGWFVTTRSTWYSGQEPVATMLFRVLKFRPPEPAAPSEPPAPPEPPAQPASPGVLRPVVTPDTEFFWAGTARGELRIQRCGECGALRHPPGPMCPRCGAARPEYQVAAGTGKLYSFVVHHHPPVPGRTPPFVVALVTLTEGVRMVGELRGVPPDRVRIGLPVRAAFVRVDENLTLPAWEPAGEEDRDELPSNRHAAGAGPNTAEYWPARLRHHAPPGPLRCPGAEDPASRSASLRASGATKGGPPGPTAREGSRKTSLPELTIDVTPTLVVATAIATRDFQDVHHDRVSAIQRGGKDIFLNILTTTGLVQRYVTDWAGPEALVRKIAIRLGVPCYAGDTLTFTGQVAGPADPADGDGRYVVEVTGRCSLGDHVIGTVHLAVAPAGPPPINTGGGAR